MAYARSQTVVDRPIAVVFAFVADGENNAAWRGSILEVARTSETAGLGATYRQAISGPNGRRVKHDYKVTEYREPTAFAFKHEVGVAKPSGRFEFTADGADRTMVTFEMQWKPRGPQRVFDNMIDTWIKAEVGRLEQLKQVLEQRVGSDG